MERFWVNQPVIKENKIAILAIAAWALMLIAAGNGWIDPNTRAVSITAFGAVCDGSTDDQPAFTAARNWLTAHNADGSGKIIVPTAPTGSLGCVVKEPINLSNSYGITVEGQNTGEPNAGGVNSSAIVGETGSAPIFDMTGANDSEVRDLTLLTSGASASCKGFLEARSSTVTFAQDQKFDNVWVYFGSNSSCNSGLGNIGWYNYGAEIGSLTNSHADADNPIWWTPTNTQIAATSPNVTIATGTQSMSGWKVTGGGYSSELGTPITTGDSSQTGTVDDITLDRVYLSHGSFHAKVSDFAITANVGINDWNWTGNVEQFTQAVEFIGGKSGQLRLSPQLGAATNSSLIFKLDGNAGVGLATSLQESDLCPSFKAAATGVNPTATVADDNGGTNTLGVQSSHLCLPHLAKLSLHNSSAGDIITSPDSTPTVAIGSGATEIFNGVIFSNQIGTVTGNPAAEVGPSAASGNLYNVTVPGGTLGTNHIIRCVFDGTYFNNSSGVDAPTFAVLYGGVGHGISIAGGTNITNTNFNYPFRIVFDLTETGATNAQSFFGTMSLGATNPATTNDLINRTVSGSDTVDSTTNQNISLVVNQTSNANINSKLYYGACTLSN